MNVVEDVRSYLTVQGIVDGSTGWPSYRRRMSDQGGDVQVVIEEDGGPPPEIGRATGIGSAAFQDLGVLITVRASAWDGDSSSAKAREILSTLHGVQGTTLGSNRYLSISALTAGPIFLGFDDQGRPMHTIAFRLVALMPPAA